MLHWVPSPTPGGQGHYLVYYRDVPGEEGADAFMYFVRVLPPQRTGDAEDAPYVFRKARIINQWTLTQNPPAVTPFGDDYALLWRLRAKPGAPEVSNLAEYWFAASGIFESGLTDFDDAGHIARRGLWESLAAVAGDPACRADR